MATASYGSQGSSGGGGGGGGGLSPIADQTLLGNISGASAIPIGLTAAQVNTLLNPVLQLIETKNILADVASITFSGLSGDTDGIYELEFNCISGVGETAADGCVINPNGLTTNLSYLGSYEANTAASPTNTLLGGAAFPIIALVAVAGSSWTARVTIFPKSGTQRTYHTEFTAFNTTTTSRQAGRFNGWWSDTATVISSLTFAMASGKLGFGAGSTCSLWRRRLSA